MFCSHNIFCMVYVLKLFTNFKIKIKSEGKSLYDCVRQYSSSGRVISDKFIF